MAWYKIPTEEMSESSLTLGGSLQDAFKKHSFTRNYHYTWCASRDVSDQTAMTTILDKQIQYLT